MRRKYLLKKKWMFLVLVLLNFTGQAQFMFNNIDSLHTALKQAEVDSVQMGTAARIGFYYWNKDPGKASEYLKKAYKMETADKEFEATYKLLAATLLARNAAAIGDITQESNWTNASRQFLSKTRNPFALDYAYEQFALFNINASKLDSGIYYATKAINMWDSVKMPEKSLRAYFTIANTYFMMRFPEKSLQALRRVMALSGLTVNDKSPMLLNIFRLMGDVFSLTNSYDSVLYYVNKGSTLAKLYDNNELMVDYFVLQCTALEGKKMYSDAIKFAEKGYQLAKSIGYDAAFANLFQVQALAYAALKQPNQAQALSDSCEKYRRLFMQSILELDDMYKIRATVYQRLGNYEMAFAYKDSQYVVYKKYRDSVRDAEVIANDIKFQTEKKELQITALKATAKQQQTTQWLILSAFVLSLIASVSAFYSYKNKKKLADTLSQANKEKDIFLKEIHHRVKNNLQIISSLLYMQFKDAKDEKMLSQLKQAQDRIKSMALVHNKLYETSDVVHVYLKDYIKDLAAGILASNTPYGTTINFDVQADDSISLSLDASISIGLILNELITNSCKYAFQSKNSGELQVKVSKVNTHLELVVSDDGVGLPSDFETKNSLGLRLVKNLARQLGGSANFETSGGTTVRMTFAVAV